MRKFSKECRPFTKENVAKLSNNGGVYIFYNRKKEPIYVGKWWVIGFIVCDKAVNLEIIKGMWHSILF